MLAPRVRSWRTGVVLPAAALALSACAPNAPAPPREPAVSGPEAAGPAAVRPSLAVGALHACVLRAQGDVLCWGYNASGQLGRRSGSRRPAPAPAPVEGLRDVRLLALGPNQSCAIAGGGRVLCWGAKSPASLVARGQADVPSPEPTPVEGVTGAQGLALGGRHACAIVGGGRVVCWGGNEQCELGRQPTMNEMVGRGGAPNVLGELIGISQVSLAHQRTCAVAANGQVHCWGFNGQLQLGRPPRTPDDLSQPSECMPAPVRGVDRANQVSLGINHSCALTDEGTVFCWGSNFSGELGRTADRTLVGGVSPGKPAGPVEGLRDVRQVALGMTHSCALTDGGDVFCWGNNHYGQLGHTNNLGTEAPNAKPTRVEGLHGVRQIGLGAHTSCALTQEEHVYCWGDGRHGQLGDPATSGRDRPNPRPLLVVGR